MHRKGIQPAPVGPLQYHALRSRWAQSAASYRTIGTTSFSPVFRCCTVFLDVEIICVHFSPSRYMVLWVENVALSRASTHHPKWGNGTVAVLGSNKTAHYINPCMPRSLCVSQDSNTPYECKRTKVYPGARMAASMTPMQGVDFSSVSANSVCSTFDEVLV